jgi:hypothetical protein
MMLVSMMNDICDGEDVIAGASAGAQALSKLIEAVSEEYEIVVVVVDFKGVAVATASFLREAVLGFRDYCRNSRPNLYPVLANVGVKVREELDGLLQLKGDAVVVCDLNGGGHVKSAAIVGKLDPKQRITLAAVLKARRADASSLAAHDRELKNPTAWNNRLASLAAKGILRETQTGRSKTYEPVVEALSYGH